MELRLLQQAVFQMTLLQRIAAGFLRMMAHLRPVRLERRMGERGINNVAPRFSLFGVALPQAGIAR